MTLQTPVGIGVIGAGMISEQYLANLAQYPDVRVVVVGDLDVARARAQAERHGVPDSGTPDDVLAHPDARLVVNLTIPAVHAEVSMRALEAGMHVWSEKPISVDLASGRALLARADELGLRVGIAPDTVLGQGVQSGLRAIAAGVVGEPIGATTVMQYAGPDRFHPNPEFLFAPGGGPVLDMGPYYLTTLVSALGAIRRVTAVGRTPQPTRTIQVGERVGESFPVGVPTHVHAIVELERGVAQSTFSWDSALRRTGVVEISGTAGTLRIPDPNMFEGPLEVTRVGLDVDAESVWEAVPAEGAVGGRGIGIVDMVRAIREGRPHRASGELALHVLEAMLAIETSIRTGEPQTLDSSVAAMVPVEADFDPTLAHAVRA
ncbi:Gfo/Idh/MocA family oxidoreductase [Agrococcus versicolor]|uniref:Gfo/Idh/MocA family oxidoreductase n=1 Tax=Agrococcus versicolor TaxID=501482 RepID=A0ABN3ALS8_9MICO